MVAMARKSLMAWTAVFFATAPILQLGSRTKHSVAGFAHLGQTLQRGTIDERSTRENIRGRTHRANGTTLVFM